MINLKYAMAEAPTERQQWYRGKLQEAEQLYFGEVAELNDVNSVEVAKPNPALAQLESDAKEFDCQQDCEEIDATKIPF
jgi:hypothetical protein